MSKPQEGNGRSASPSSVLAELVDRLAARMQAGEAVDWESVAREHPEHAGELRGLLPALGGLDELSRSGDGSAPGSATPADGTGPLDGLLGDFRIVREVGRGGMGVVYEAEQISLKRRVALKVLPFAATMDPRHLQRFHNEAQAAACLHHTNIVPVHAVGSERGVHFYAMQYIDGQPLSEVVRQLRRAGQDKAEGTTVSKDRTAAYMARPGEEPPAAATVRAAADETPLTGGGRRGREYFRRVAELGVQAAEALDHAHQLGIVHRDVKPANLLLDGTGRLWVTDFGLAQVQHGEASLTRTGDLVGTLRYMSPEQALARRVVIDHRTDVYSLGATLYELLTLQPVFRGDDRQELLRQIAFEEPVKPRRLDRAIPAELETVVLKALQKNPADRYATAQELADDLRHWLEDRPIRARRPSWRQVAARWARRHRAIVWAASLVALVVGLLGAANGGWWLQKRAALGREVGLALDEADRLQAEGNCPRALLTARRARGLMAGGSVSRDVQERAERRLADLEMVARLEEIRLRKLMVKEEHFDSEQADPAYQTAFRGYGIDVTALDPEEAARRIQTTSIRVELAAALDNWTLTRIETRKIDDPGWKELLPVARAADPDPWRDRVREAIDRGDRAALERLADSEEVDRQPASTVVLLASALRDQGRLERAAAVLANVRPRQPGDFWINHDLGYTFHFMKPPRLEEAIRFYTAAVAIRPESPGTRNNLGNVLAAKGRLDEAIAEYQEAIRIKKDYAQPHYNLGAALARKGRPDEAIAEWREAIRLNKGFAEAHNDLGNALRDKGLVDEAIAECREALRLKKVFPVARHNLGVALHDKGRLDEAIAECREAIRLKKDFAEAHNSLGVALREKGRLDGAVAEYREAIRIKKDYVWAHCNLGSALHHKGRLDEAIAEYQEAIRIKKDFAGAHYGLGNALYHKGRLDEAIEEYREAIRLEKDYALAHYNLGNALRDKGRLDEAVAEYREALRIKKDYAEAHCNLGLALRQTGQFRQAVEELRRGHQLGFRNPRWPYPSAQWVRDAERLADLDARLPRLLSGQDRLADADDRLAVAVLCRHHKKLFAAAARWYGKAFAADPRLTLNLAAGHRYNAACAAALAAAGQGKDADKLESKERARLRKQALDWLRADLGAWRTLLEKEPEKVRPVLIKQLIHWQKDPDFAGVRGAQALARLPEAERPGWQKLWADVADTLAAAQRSTAPDRKADGK